MRIFDESDSDEFLDDSTQPSKKKGKKSKKDKPLSWWDEFESDRDVIFGFGAAAKTTDSDAGRAYSYDKAFDDSDSAWYRQNNFRYGAYQDYSPSSLFRSSFLSFGYGFSSYRGQSSDTKNKAVRALRTLKRNANTVAQASAKISYDVQFSDGTDSNGASADLTTGKAQTIFVSPDAICKTKTPEEEDAAVDALTGFVLLRVQLTQSVPSEVIREINKTAIRAMAAEAAKILQDNFATASAADIAATVADNYSAGLLAKSLLTRLSRRAVVEDWGGFAPYFVRHAKQFAGTKDQLVSNTELSTELLAAKIAYNMIAAEDEIELAPDVTAIVNKHLSEQLPAEKMLDTCRALVNDLREYVISQSADDKLPDDTLEGMLQNELQNFIDERAAAAEATRAEAEAMREHMQNMANTIDDMAGSDNLLESNPKTSSDATPLATALIDQWKQLSDLRLAEAFISNINAAIKGLNGALKSTGDTEEDAANARELRVKIAQQHLNNALHHYSDAGIPQRFNQRHGIDFAAATNFVNKSADAVADTNSIKAQIAALKQLVKGFKHAMAEDTAKINTAIANAAQLLQEKIAAQLTNATEKIERWGKVSEQLTEVATKFDSAAGPYNFATMTRKNCKKYEESLTTSQAAVTAALGKLAHAHKLTELQNLADELRKLAGRSFLTCADLRNNLPHANYAAHQFIESALTHHENHFADSSATPISAWHADAIADFLRTIGATKETAGDAMSHALRETNAALFDKLQKMFKTDEGYTNIPQNVQQLKTQLDANALNQFNNIAAALGLTAQQLLNVLNNLSTDDAQSNSSQLAAKISAIVQEKLAPIASQNSAIDDALFGDIVTTTTDLDAAAISQINTVALNAAEEDYVAYLSHNSAMPSVTVKKAQPHEMAAGQRIVARIIAKNRGAVAKIRESLQFQDTQRKGEVHGMRSGDLDEGSLHKLRYDSEYIWSQKTVSKLPDVAVGILVDQSGSMNTSYKIDQAREMCIVLSDAVRKIAGVHLHIYGHTANKENQEDLTLFEHYSSTASAEHADLSALGNIRAHNNNYDGYAIKEAAKLLYQDPAQRKYLFVISDGLPHGRGYSGEEAEKHVASVCSFVRTRLKIPTYAFAVGVYPEDRGNFETQYGKPNVLFLSTILQCLPQITRFLRNAIQKEKTLVNVSVE
jgi:hypothetical protein